MEEILRKIIEKRKENIKKKGINFNHIIPTERNVPLSLPDFKSGVIICEIKRGSPSEGKMNNIIDPINWAGEYIDAGAGAISVLTEEDFFYGSLSDLMNIKNKYPHIPVLRKDFLLSTDEIVLSYKAGADLVLLITSILVDEDCDTTLLKSMMNKAEHLGMMPLIEVHNKKELESVLSLNPKLIGINARDLKTFKINRGYPIGLKELIKDKSYIIYESGIRNKTDSFFIGSSGFNGILVGTSIVKSGYLRDKIAEIKNGFIDGLNNPSKFYDKIFKKRYIDNKTVVKICGITNMDDAKAAVKNGADIIGFIFAKSPRRIDIDKAEVISNEIGSEVLKVGVVVDEFLEEAAEGVKNGWLDAVQFHGEIDNEKADSFHTCWYKVIRVRETSNFHCNYYSPIILYDTFSKELYGGTGKQINDDLLNYAKENNIDLCIAGGINPENVAYLIKTYNPILIDASSGLEERPGKKDHEKIKAFFCNINKLYN